MHETSLVLSVTFISNKIYILRWPGPHTTFIYLWCINWIKIRTSWQSRYCGHAPLAIRNIATKWIHIYIYVRYERIICYEITMLVKSMRWCEQRQWIGAGASNTPTLAMLSLRRKFTKCFSYCGDTFQRSFWFFRNKFSVFFSIATHDLWPALTLHRIWTWIRIRRCRRCPIFCSLAVNGVPFLAKQGGQFFFI